MGLRCADSSFDILQRAARHLRCHRVNLTTLQGRILGFARPASAGSRFVAGGQGNFFSSSLPRKWRAREYRVHGSLRYDRPGVCERRLIRHAYVFSSKIRSISALVLSPQPPALPTRRPGPEIATRLCRGADYRAGITMARVADVFASASGNTGYV